MMMYRTWVNCAGSIRLCVAINELTIAIRLIINSTSKTFPFSATIGKVTGANMSKVVQLKHHHRTTPNIENSKVLPNPSKYKQTLVGPLFLRLQRHPKSNFSSDNHSTVGGSCLYVNRHITFLPFARVYFGFTSDIGSRLRQIVYVHTFW